MTVSDARVELESVLQADGIRVVRQGQASPPSVFIVPGNPWLEPIALGQRKRQINLGIMAVVSAASEVAIQDQENLAESIDVACRKLPDPWGLPTFNAPGYLLLTGLPYIAFRVDIRVII